MTPQEVVDLLNSAGVLGLLVLVIFVTLAGLYRGWWVPGPFYREAQQRIEKLEKTNDGYEAHFETITSVQKAMMDRQVAFEQSVTAQLREITDTLRDQPPRRSPR